VQLLLFGNLSLLDMVRSSQGLVGVVSKVPLVCPLRLKILMGVLQNLFTFPIQQSEDFFRPHNCWAYLQSQMLFLLFEIRHF